MSSDFAKRIPEKCSSYCLGCFMSFRRDIQQIYALTMKNIVLHWRQWKSNLCGLVTPILCMFWMFVLQLIVTYIIVPRIEDSFKNNHSHDFKAQMLDLMATQEIALHHNKSIPTDVLYFFESNKETEHYLSSPFPEPNLYLRNKSSSHEINELIFNSMEKIADDEDYRTPYLGSLKFKNFDLEKSEVNYILQYLQEGGGRREGIDEFCRDLNDLTVNPGYCEFVIGTSLMNYINSIYIHHVTNNSLILRTTVSQMPYKKAKFEFNGDLVQLMGVFFYPLILLLSLPTILYTLVLEKESKLKEMMRLMGLKERNYVSSTFCFKLFWFCLSLTLFVLLGIILQHRVFMQTNYLVIIPTFFGSGLLVVSMGFFLSSFITSSFVATVIGYIAVIFSPIIGIFLIRFIMTDGNYEYKWMLLAPPLPVISCVQQMITKCLKYQCLGLEAYSSENYDFLIAFIMIFVDSIIFFILSLYIDAVTPKPWGVRKSPIFCLEWICCCFPSMDFLNLNCKKRRNKKYLDELLSNDNNEFVDEDVLEIKRKILNGELTKEENGILVDGLYKIFGRKKAAVDGLFFNVKKKECFGLLGPNGAGKTTTIRILCGLFAQSKGTSFVDGHDIRTEMPNIRDKIGLCPQFSVVWPDLTCREHLLFYSRLKSFSFFGEYKESEEILATVGLHDPNQRKKLEKMNPCLRFLILFWRFFFPKETKAKQLSGGMRRRLSIGISLCGNPKIILLDEPTTGLDPENRRSIWDVILKEKRGRCVVLTTHSMEEADSLSDRIGIMKSGKLVCIGTKLHLKKKFGNGYTLTMKYEKKRIINNEKEKQEIEEIDEEKKISIEEEIEEIDEDTDDSNNENENNENENNNNNNNKNKNKRRDYIVEEIKKLLSPYARLEIVKELGEHLTYQLTPFEEHEITILEEENNFENFENENFEKKERKKFSVSRIFEIMEKKKKELGIIEFELNQTTLEDVFLNVIKKNEEQEITKTKSIIQKKSKSLLENKKKILDINKEEEKNILDLYDSYDNNNNNNEEQEENNDEFLKIPNKDEINKNDSFKDIQINQESSSSVSINEESEDEESENNNNQKKTKNKRNKMKIPTCINRFKMKLKDNFLQIFFLMYKNWLLSLRGWKSSCLQLISPFIVVLILFLLSLVVEYRSKKWYIDPPHSTLKDLKSNDLESCHSWAGGRCLVVCYSVNNDGFGEIVMDDFIEFYGLVEEKDYKVFQYDGQLENFLFQNPNITQTAISFSNKTKEIPIPNNNNNNNNNENIENLKFLKMKEYGLYFNSTKDLDNQVMEFKLILDNFIQYNYRLHLLKEQKETIPRFPIKVTTEEFPKIISRQAENGQSNVLGSTGPLFFTCAAMVLFLVSLYRLVFEKEHKLRSGLEMIGMRNFSYFCSWFSTFTIFGVLMSFITVLSGYIFVIDVFVYSNPVFTFLLFFMFDLSLVCFAFALSPFLNTTKTALILGFIILAITFILNLFIANGTLCYYLFNLGDEYFWVPLLFELLYPPFNFAKFFQDIITKTVKKYDSSKNKFVSNDGYWGFGDVFNQNKMEMFTIELDVQASFVSFLFLVLNCVFFMIVFWYFDNVLVQGKKIWFPFTCCCESQCCINCKESRNNHLDDNNNNQENLSLLNNTRNNFHPKSKRVLERMDEDIRAEYFKVRDPNYPASLRLANLRKKYRSILGKSVHALKGIDLTLKRGSVLGLLGHNGAGKSTAINSIAGLINPSSGEVLVDDLTTTKYRDLIRKDLGVTLQHNLLWDDLTAKDHIRLFSQIKGILGCKRMKKEIEDRLKEVSLFHVRNDRTKTFSGGMKRRLNVSLGYVNKPKIVLLDEPTTGLDPFSKREVWNLIREKKNFSSILLTTHSMEEADYLSEKISILQEGRVLCIGDSLHLKTKYGAGYVIKFNCAEGKEQEFEDLVRDFFPHCELESSNACNYIYNIRTEHIDELIDGLKKVEDLVNIYDEKRKLRKKRKKKSLDEEEEEGEEGEGEGIGNDDYDHDDDYNDCIIKNFGISNTTLEAVYLRVTKADEIKDLIRKKEMKDVVVPTGDGAGYGNTNLKEDIDYENNLDDDIENSYQRNIL